MNTGKRGGTLYAIAASRLRTTDCGLILTVKKTRLMRVFLKFQLAFGVLSGSTGFVQADFFTLNFT